MIRGFAKGRDQKFGFVDVTGRLIIPAQYDWAGKFVNGRAQVRIGGKIGFVDERGQLIVPAIYDFAKDYSGDLAAVAWGQIGKDRQWRIIDLNGRIIVQPKYGWIGEIHEGMIIVGSQATSGQPMRFGAIDTTGHLVIDTVYEGLTGFSEGLAAVKLNGKIGFISKNGDFAISSIYEYAKPFVGGLAIVTVKGANDRRKQGVIDIHGKYVIPPEYDLISGIQGWENNCY